MATTIDRPPVRGRAPRRLWRGTAAALATALLGTVGAVLPSGAAHAAGPGQLVYVSNAGAGTVSAVDTATGSTVATIAVGSAPTGVALTPDGSQAWVANGASDSVSVIDTATNSVAATVAVGRTPQSVAISPDGGRAYVVRTADAGGVDVIDTSSLAVTATIAAGDFPDIAGLSPDGGRLYVGNFSSRTVSVIDTASNTVTATVPVGDAAGLAVSPDGAHVYVADYNDSRLSVIDTATATVTATVPVGSLPQNVAVSPDGGLVYVANRGGNSVSVVDTATNTVVATVPTGAGTSGVLADPDGTRVYATNTFVNTMSVIDTATLTVTSTVPTGSRPWGLAMGKAVLPAVTALTPDRGPSTGGTTVTLTGSHLTGTTAVTFDGTPAGSVTVVDDTTVTATAPAHSAGTVGVSLTARGRTVAAGSYTYQAPAPGVTALAPAKGPASGGTAVTLTGTGFTGATAVAFGTVPAASFTVHSDTEITAISPAATAAGPADVTVTTPGGTSATGPADRYTYTRDTTKLSAEPLLFSLPPGQLSINLKLSATLTDTTTGKPVSGATVKFAVGTAVVCSAATNAAGIATCTGVGSVVAVLLNLGYTATYNGSPAMEAATTTAGLIRIG
ncbi:IPT/TIG domain-containing protein [Streptomyces sp. NPDC096319]|uniref:IPT/TIG domain-containing protein n=1 Tax=Streptomyces sp. NPDC096319 TaxID=3366084 RepID=UPI0038292E9E